MAGVIMTSGIESLADNASTVLAWLDTLTCHLFQNNHVPAVGDVASMYTEANFDGYAPMAMNNWADQGTDANGNEKWTNPDLTWTDTGASTPNTVYGYYWTDAMLRLVAAELASASFVMNGAGLKYIVSPAFYAGQILPPV